MEHSYKQDFNKVKDPLISYLMYHQIVTKEDSTSYYMINRTYFDKNKTFFTFNFQINEADNTEITNFCTITDLNDIENQKKLLYLGKGLNLQIGNFEKIRANSHIIYSELFKFTFCTQAPQNPNIFPARDPLLVYSNYFLLIYGLFKFHFNFVSACAFEFKDNILFFERTCLEISSSNVDTNYSKMDSSSFGMETLSFSFHHGDTFLGQTILLKKFEFYYGNLFEFKNDDPNGATHKIYFEPKETGSTPGFIDVIKAKSEQRHYVKELFLETDNYANIESKLQDDFIYTLYRKFNDDILITMKQNIHAQMADQTQIWKHHYYELINQFPNSKHSFFDIMSEIMENAEISKFKFLDDSDQQTKILISKHMFKPLMSLQTESINYRLLDAFGFTPHARFYYSLFFNKIYVSIDEVKNFQDTLIDQSDDADEDTLIIFLAMIQCMRLLHFLYFMDDFHEDNFRIFKKEMLYCLQIVDFWVSPVILKPIDVLTFPLTNYPITKVQSQPTEIPTIFHQTRQNQPQNTRPFVPIHIEFNQCNANPMNFYTRHHVIQPAHLINGRPTNLCTATTFGQKVYDKVYHIRMHQARGTLETASYPQYTTIVKSFAPQLRLIPITLKALDQMFIPVIKKFWTDEFINAISVTNPSQLDCSKPPFKIIVQSINHFTLTHVSSHLDYFFMNNNDPKNTHIKENFENSKKILIGNSKSGLLNLFETIINLPFLPPILFSFPTANYLYYTGKNTYLPELNTIVLPKLKATENWSFFDHKINNYSYIFDIRSNCTTYMYFCPLHPDQPNNYVRDQILLNIENEEEQGKIISFPSLAIMDLCQHFMCKKLNYQLLSITMPSIGSEKVIILSLRPKESK